jgi:hypothetical protein
MDPITFRVLRRIERAGDKLWQQGDHDAARRVWMIHGQMAGAAFGFPRGLDLYGELRPAEVR